MGRAGAWRGNVGIGKTSFEEWLEPFLDRRAINRGGDCAPLYVGGLIGPGDIRRAFSQWRSGLRRGIDDQLHHFVAAGVWDAAPLETDAAHSSEIGDVGGSDAVLVIDDTAVPKKGTHSVGVAAQYASALGKTANCR